MDVVGVMAACLSIVRVYTVQSGEALSRLCSIHTYEVRVLGNLLYFLVQPRQQQRITEFLKREFCLLLIIAPHKNQQRFS